MNETYLHCKFQHQLLYQWAFFPLCMRACFANAYNLRGCKWNIFDPDMLMRRAEQIHTGRHLQKYPFTLIVTHAILAWLAVRDVETHCSNQWGAFLLSRTDVNVSALSSAESRCCLSSFKQLTSSLLAKQFLYFSIKGSTCNLLWKPCCAHVECGVPHIFLPTQKL